MPRIAFILEVFYGDAIGGAERQVQILAEVLREAGWETAYICQRSIDKPDFETVDGMEVYAIPSRKRSLTLLNYSALSQAMDRCKADIFYQRVRIPFTGLAAYAARKLKKPMVFAAASRADVIRNVDLRAANKDRSKLDRLLHPMNRFAEDWGILHADALIMQTNEQANLIQQHYGRQGIVIPNHIKVHPDSDPLEKEKRIIWVSNVKPLKRPELFLKLAKRCNDLDVEFLMVGGCADNTMRQNLEKATQEIENFKYVGPFHPDSADIEIAKSLALVNTSTFEGFPNAFQQAWAHGVPTFSLGIDPDGVIQEYELGASCASLDDLEIALRSFLSDTNRMERTRVKARTFALKTYDIKKLLPRYVDAFNSLMRP